MRDAVVTSDFWDLVVEPTHIPSPRRSALPTESSVVIFQSDLGCQMETHLSWDDMHSSCGEGFEG